MQGFAISDGAVTLHPSHPRRCKGHLRSSWVEPIGRCEAPCGGLETSLSGKADRSTGCTQTQIREPLETEVLGIAEEAIESIRCASGIILCDCRKPFQPVVLKLGESNQRLGTQAKDLGDWSFVNCRRTRRPQDCDRQGEPTSHPEVRS